jgi:hypothetical protein
MRGSITLGRRGALALAAAATLFLLTTSVAAVAQQAALVGTWTIVVSDTIMPDGTRVPTFGPNPDGAVTFDAGGRYSLQIIRSNLPKFASNNRLQGTPDENKSIVHGLITHIGTYSVDGNSIVFRVEGSSFPNWSGTVQKRPYRIAGENLIWQTPAASGGGSAEIIWRKAK